MAGWSGSAFLDEDLPTYLSQFFGTGTQESFVEVLLQFLALPKLGHPPLLELSHLEILQHTREMRGIFGVHLAWIATRFRLDVEDELAVIFPAKVEP